MKNITLLGADGKFRPRNTNTTPIVEEVLQAIDSSEVNDTLRRNYMKEMADLEWTDYEPASGRGHFRFYPKGHLISNLLRDFLEITVERELEAFQIITPFLYRWNREGIQSQAQPFAEKIYRVYGGEDEELVLRFNADVGLFEMLSTGTLEACQLPVRFYETARCFRCIQNGEVSGVSHGKSFLLLDMHSICKNWDQALNEYMRVYTVENNLAGKLGIETVTHFRVPESSLPLVKVLLADLARNSTHPAIVEILPSQKYYWMMKHASFTNGGDKLFHIQLDKESFLHYGAENQVQDSGKLGNFVVLHNSLASAERWMTIFLKAALKKKTPSLPLWLAPIQVRVLPVGETHLEFCVKLAESLKTQQIRADVDDRRNSVGWKIRAAEREWVPYIIVCGDKEVNGGKLSVRIRGEGEKGLSQEEVVQFIKGVTAGMPFRSLPGMLVSKRPVFRGRD
jgi:threonyl-tRNA synthetase